MSIKCSLLGHKFSGTEVEEEREEQGSEVVITVKEVEACGRCGERRVISENKEVTSLAASGDAVSESAPEPDTAETAGADTGSGPASSPNVSAAEDDVELLDASSDGPETAADEGSDGSEPAPDVATVGETSVDDPETAEDDGAVILDDGEPEREPGAWPADETTPEDRSEPDPEAIERAATETADGSETVPAGKLDGDEWPDEYSYEEKSGTAPEVDWPEEDEGDSSEWEPGDSLTQRIDGDAERAGTAAVTVPEGEFYCTECEFTTLVEESSLRAGDFCPSCRRGTLEHRTEDATRKE